MAVGVWIGFVVRMTTLAKKGLLRQEVFSTLGDDILDYRVACSEEMRNSGEYYIFILCKRPTECIELLVKSRSIVSVIPDRNSPHFFSDKEVDDFVSSACYRKEDDVEWSVGDFVRVRSGYLGGLYGVVVKVLSSNKCLVSFSLYVRVFSDKLNVSNLEYICKTPGFHEGLDVNKPIVIGTHIVHKSKLYR